jgi:hypothetical protein
MALFTVRLLQYVWCRSSPTIDPKRSPNAVTPPRRGRFTHRYAAHLQARLPELNTDSVIMARDFVLLYAGLQSGSLDAEASGRAVRAPNLAVRIFERFYDRLPFGRLRHLRPAGAQHA